MKNNLSGHSFVPYQLAVKARKIKYGIDKHGTVHFNGFYYDTETEEVCEAHGFISSPSDARSAAPTYSQLIDYIREKFNVHIIAIPNITFLRDWEDELDYYYSVYTYEGIHSSRYIETYSYEDALAAGIDLAINYILDNEK